MERYHAISDLEEEESDTDQEMTAYDQVKAGYILRFGYSPTILRESLGSGSFG